MKSGSFSNDINSDFDNDIGYPCTQLWHWTRDNLLYHRAPRHVIVANQYTKPKGRASSIRKTSIININIKKYGLGWSSCVRVPYRYLMILFRTTKMRLTRIMNIKINFLNHVWDIKTNECQILQGPQLGYDIMSA